MIRLRCEMGLPPRHAAGRDRAGDPDWIKTARHCAALQARSIVATGHKIVPLPALAVLGLPPLTLCADGILEPLTWEESLTGAIRRVRRVDLSFASARILVLTHHLPRCFLPALIAHDLLHGTLSRGPDVETTFLAEEFAAWVGCSDLSVV